MNKNILIKSLEKILEIRVAEEMIAKKFKENNIYAFLHLYVGQEASAVGISKALNSNDIVFGNHRSHGHYLSKGGNFDKMIFEIFGDLRGCCKGYGGSMHMLDRKVNFAGSGPILGSVAPITMGMALSLKLKNKKNIAVGFLGDGSAEEGSFYESVNLGGLYNVPALLIIEDNKFSVESNHEDRKVKGYNYSSLFKDGLKTIYKRVNGNNVSDVYNATKELKKNILKYKKIGLLHVDLNRLYKHSGANKDSAKSYYHKRNNLHYFDIDNDCLEVTKKILKKKGISNYHINRIENQTINLTKEKFNKVFKKIRIKY